MYRKFQKLDELFSNISISFILLLLFGFLNYKKYIDGSLYDIDSWLFFGMMGICLVFTGYNIVLFLLNQRHPNIDIELNFDKKQIKLNNGKKVYEFSDISLFGYNAIKKDSRFYLNGQLFGVLNENLLNEKEEKVTQLQMELIGEESTRVKHQHLYNYPITILVLLMILFFVFAFIYKHVVVLGITVISTYVFAGLLLLFSLLLLVNYLRLKQLMKKHQKVILTQEMTSEGIEAKESNETL